MTQNRGTAKTQYQKLLEHSQQNSYYSLLGLHPSASSIEIRRAYWELSKRYHPDTTELPAETAKENFQKINEAYATLSNPERRMVYDEKIRYSRIAVSAPSQLHQPQNKHYQSNSAYLDPTDRPLSAGEIFALFLLCLTFIGCLFLAIIVGLTRGDTLPASASLNPPAQIIFQNPQKSQLHSTFL
ncbi:DnaJ domain-containing protein [Ancylothrix sp. C2]|uniref:J domain-containing protein n=1 Tax=Ancylothrix sp. D3o TaxID=2953691 RepID=UPI0021BB7BBE|nr:DnaJ domain-containing protein [Ancylothrix sp. D3o]MCT7950725.1 DnaJ domain-containing protein [Ancylothrix sp. D3o]